MKDSEGNIAQWNRIDLLIHFDEVRKDQIEKAHYEDSVDANYVTFSGLKVGMRPSPGKHVWSIWSCLIVDELIKSANKSYANEESDGINEKHCLTFKGRCLLEDYYVEERRHQDNLKAQEASLKAQEQQRELTEVFAWLAAISALGAFLNVFLN